MIRRKSSIVSVASVSNGAGASTVGTAIDIRGTGLDVVYLKITNGAIGPTVACVATVQVSPDGTSWFDLVTRTSGVMALAVASWTELIPEACAFVRTNFTGNTVQPVTVEGVVQIELNAVL